ncbi:MAG: phosphonopyruvate decarboxylase [Geminicoccaceae bacterium]|nr:phosphonopyruvate decarboxylase [Geminicoccaceae bacterium]
MPGHGRALFELFARHDIRHVVYVPDAGHSELIDLVTNDERFICTPLTTEEEGVAYLAGAWLGGERGALLMQSSGVGNCINMLGLSETCRFPLLMFITMRGEWAEQNPWQHPMSRAVQPCLEAMNVIVQRASTADGLADTTEAAIEMAYAGDHAIAVLLGQRLIGRKTW